MTPADQAFLSAVRHHQAGQLPQAEALYRQVLAQAPDHADALHMLGVLVLQSDRFEIGIDLVRRAVAARPEHAAAWQTLGNAMMDTARPDEAIACYRRAAALKPDHAGAHYNLATALKGRGQTQEAIASFRRAVSLNPNYSEAHSGLGAALADTGLLDEAAAALSRAVALNPRYVAALNNLGNVLARARRHEQAIDCYRRSLALRPDFAEAHNNLGNSLRDTGRAAEAIACYRQALALKPHYAEAHMNLGSMLAKLGQLDEALVCCSRALSLAPDLAEAHSNLGNILKDRGELDAAITAYQRALAIDPADASAHSNLALVLQYHPGQSAEAIYEEHLRWNQRHAAPLRSSIRSHENARDPQRRLRVGYMSPDFRAHSVAYFIESPLAAHGHEQVDVFCYSDVLQGDAVTSRLQEYNVQWRNIAGLTDQQAAEQVFQDRIDILVDLAGHTANNRLPVFARKPAPVQVTYLGYPGTTGLQAIDYRLTDAIADPPETTERFHSEKLVRLPRCFLCYRPAGGSQAPAPALPQSPVTFGSFNACAKINPQLLAWWAEILLRLPGSRLLLKNAAMGDGGTRQRLLKCLANLGIEPSRVDLRPLVPDPAEHLRLYHHVHVALDTSPYHGTTTTCEALWMGVPVVSLAGRSHVSRVGASLLTNIGLPDLVAQTPEQYVNVAVALAADLPRLEHLRSTLRQQMQASPLMDAARFTRDLEAAYRLMWQAWCGGHMC